jgi:hypothetical protein
MGYAGFSQSFFSWAFFPFSKREIARIEAIRLRGIAHGGDFSGYSVFPQ